MPDFNNQQNQWNNNYSNGSQQPYVQNPNNQYNNYNNYPQNINQQNPYPPNNMEYIPQQPVKSKSPKLIYIILIAVIIFFAVIIVLMSTSIRAMFNSENNQTGGNEQNNIIVTENTQETTKEETTTTTKQITTTTTTEPVPETVTVTVIVEVEKEVVKEVEVPVQNDYTDIYSGAYYACVSTVKDPLNIRSGAGKSYKVLGSIPKGKYIDVYMTSDSNWYYTTYGGVSGYVSADYITLIMSGEFYGYDEGYDGYYDDNYIADGDGHNGDWATIATQSDPLNLRSSPSTSASIITAIPKGSSVYVNYEYDSTWCYITWNSYSGYVSTQYLAF